MNDFVTVISPSNDAVLTKKATMVNGKIKVASAANHKFFKSEQREVNSIKSLSNLLFEIEDQPNKAVIRGALLDSVNPDHHKRRKLRDGGGPKNEQSYREAEHRWVMIDIDGLTSDSLVFHDPVNHPLDTILCIVGLLPTPFQRANFHYQYSSSQGLKPRNSISCHIWFWMDRTVNDRDLKRYFTLYNESSINAGVIDIRIVDTVLFESIQLHFTANPVIDGFEDPLPKRSGFYDERADEVKISDQWIYDDPKKKGNYLKFVDRIGDDKDGFHEPIMQAGGSFINEFGKPTPQQQAMFVEVVQEAIDEAHVKESRGDGEIGKYRSEYFIVEQLHSALGKGFDRGVPDGQIAEILGQTVYVAAGDNFYFPETRSYMTKEAVNMWYAHLTGGRAIVPMLASSSDLRRVQNVQCIPGNTNEIVTVKGVEICNSWAGRPDLEDATDEDVIPIVEAHIRYLVDDDPDAYRHLTSYLAWCLRRPGHKIRHAIVLGGKQGIGKSFIKPMMTALMGDKNVHPVSNSEIKEKFNGWIEAAEMVVVEELMAEGRLEIANRLKPLISENLVTIRKMRTDAYNIENYANFICFTNHQDAMKLDDDDRRYWVWMCNGERKGDAYYEKLFSLIKNNPKAIRQWLEGIDISNFNPNARPPDTKSKEVMIEHGRPVLEEFIQTRIEEEKWPFQCDLINLSDLQDVMPSYVGRINANKLRVELGKIGAVNQGSKRMSDGSKPKIWSIRNHEKYNDAPESLFRDSYIKPERGGTYSTPGIDF